MVKAFLPLVNDRGITFATVTNCPSDKLSFARNCNPNTGDILCPPERGGNLEVTRGGHIVFRPNGDTSPKMGEKLVLIRGSKDQSSKDFTLAVMWANEEDWNQVSWAINAHRTYRAIGYGHRRYGHPNPNFSTEIELAKGSLLEIAEQYPLNATDDTLRKIYSIDCGKLGTLTYNVRWEYLDTDGKWIECADPRPKHFNVTN